MTHISEIKTLEQRLLKSGWAIVIEEEEYFSRKGRTIGDIDLLAVKFNYYGMNMLYIEEKSGAKGRYRKAVKQINKGMKHIIETYNPDRVWAFYCHKQENIRVRCYEKHGRNRS